MQRLLLACAFVLAIPAAGAAGPACVAGTLVDYIALGAGGCTIGTATLGGFSAAQSLAGGVALSPAGITVTPTAIGSGHRLDFGLSALAGPGDLLGLLIGYSVIGLAPTRAGLEMAGSAATAASNPFDTGGVVTVVEDLCLGGAFAPFPLCSGAPAFQSVVHDAAGAFPVSKLALGPSAPFFDVFIDIAVDGGTGGSASLNGPVTVQFVPEPAPVALFGLALVAVCLRLRRRAPAGGYCA